MGRYARWHRRVLLGGAALSVVLGGTLLAVGEDGVVGVTPAAARGGGSGRGGGGWNDHGRSDGRSGGGWSDRGGGRSTDDRNAGHTPDAAVGSTPTAPADSTEDKATDGAAAGTDLHGDGSGREGLIELFGAVPEPAPPGLDATPVGPDLTHQQERALIARGWRGTP